MLRKILIILSTIIMLTTSIKFPFSSAQARSNDNSYKQKNTYPIDISKKQIIELGTNRKKLGNQSKLLKLNEKIAQVDRSIKDFQNKIKLTKIELQKATAEIQQLNDEIKLLAVNIKKRNDVLKNRAQSYQQNGQNESYIEILLGSSSFSDLINRADTVAKLIEADQSLIEQQEAVLKEYEAKKQLLAKKQSENAAKKVELEKMLLLLKAQQNKYAHLKTSVKKENGKMVSEKEFTPKLVAKGYINTVITVGQKYIGRSTYVFGGGRTATDIAHGRFDCSAFVQWAFSEAGLQIGSTTSTIKTSGKQVSICEMQPGDLVFFDTYKKDGHVGIYLGGGKFIGSQSSTGVAIADMKTGYWKSKFKGRVIRI